MHPILTDSNALPRKILRLLPFMRWLPGITRQSARADLLAGLTGAVIVLPQCVAFATLAGMPIEYGLYCAMVPALAIIDAQMKTFFGLDIPRGAGFLDTWGALPASLPPLSLPDLSGATIRETGAIALAITILALTEAVSIARSIAVRSSQRIDSTQEFTGQGLSNIAGAFFSSYPSSGSFNRSGVNYDAGARTPLAAASSALFLLAIVFAVAPLAAILARLDTATCAACTGCAFDECRLAARAGPAQGVR